MGEYPTNQLSRKFWLVPDFPATTCPFDGRAPYAVPPGVSKTPRNTCVAAPATLSSSARLASPFSSKITTPFLSMILVTTTGSRCHPPAASVVYAPAISSGVTFSVPSVIIGYAGSLACIPISWAVSTSDCAPTCSARR